MTATTVAQIQSSVETIESFAYGMTVQTLKTTNVLAGTTLSGRTEIARYHVVKSVEQCISGAEYATFLCGVECMSLERDIEEIALVGEQSTDAPMCKRCAKKAAR